MSKKISFEDSGAILLANCAHGQYMYQILGRYIRDSFASGALNHQISKETIASLCNGPDDEFYFEAADEIDGRTVETANGEKYIIHLSDDIWAIPEANYYKINWEEMV